MSFDSDEKSGYQGQPVECYRFALGGDVWTFTSSDREVTIAAGTFTPEVISSGAQDFTEEDQGSDIEIRVARTSPLSAVFIPYIPHAPFFVTRWRLHRGAEGEAVATFLGRVSHVRFEESEAILTCSPISKALGRRFPYLTYQSQCNWALYSTECGVNPTAYKTDVTVTSIDGADVISNDFTAHADGWYNNGFILREDGTRRFIVNHVGNTVTLMSAFEDLESLEVVQAFAGCQKTESDCATRFGNLDRHFGFARIPTRNPHESGI